MTAIKHTYIYCDGGKDCPRQDDGNEPFSVDDLGTATAQREFFPRAGWLYRGGKDYCDGCAKRLFNYVAKP